MKNSLEYEISRCIANINLVFWYSLLKFACFCVEFYLKNEVLHFDRQFVNVMFDFHFVCRFRVSTTRRLNGKITYFLLMGQPYLFTYKNHLLYRYSTQITAFESSVCSCLLMIISIHTWILNKLVVVLHCHQYASVTIPTLRLAWSSRFILPILYTHTCWTYRTIYVVKYVVCNKLVRLTLRYYRFEAIACPL